MRVESDRGAKCSPRNSTANIGILIDPSDCPLNATYEETGAFYIDDIVFFTPKFVFKKTFSVRL